MFDSGALPQTLLEGLCVCPHCHPKIGTVLNPEVHLGLRVLDEGSGASEVLNGFLN